MQVIQPGALRYGIREGDDSQHLINIADGARAAGSGGGLEFSWTALEGGVLYVEDTSGRQVLAAVLPPRAGRYRAPPWLREDVGHGALRWRVVALAEGGAEVGATPWRVSRLSPRTADE
jgi:hypothetical protein